ncbi:unnamed protein product, partial [Musa banksii]
NDELHLLLTARQDQTRGRSPPCMLPLLDKVWVDGGGGGGGGGSFYGRLHPTRKAAPLHCELRAVLTEHVNGSSLLSPVKDEWAHREVLRLQLIAASELCVGSVEQRCAT